MASAASRTRRKAVSSHPPTPEPPSFPQSAERLFSFSGGTISKLRNQLSEKSAHSAVMVGQWASDPDLIAVDEFESQLAEGWTRKKKRRVPNAAEAQGSSKVETRGRGRGRAGTSVDQMELVVNLDAARADALRWGYFTNYWGLDGLRMIWRPGELMYWYQQSGGGVEATNEMREDGDRERRCVTVA
ncbi:hypothetical protein B0H13DRAFT_1893651 [Mycena leptocephala]|nr:hypothetical protein B0H13DRAFT_1893651 [Mycena leptocephala]